ncbi:MAG TPA: hypothetical protein VGJ84_22805 [Polyangiaceae bacterium]
MFPSRAPSRRGGVLPWIVVGLLLGLLLLAGTAAVYHYRKPALVYRKLDAYVPPRVEMLFQRVLAKLGIQPAGDPQLSTERDSLERAPSASASASLQHETQPSPLDAASSASAGSPDARAPLDTKALKNALDQAAETASQCQQPGGRKGTGSVKLTFSPEGHPTNVALTGVFAGTDVGQCAIKAFEASQVPAFAGAPVTVTKGFAIR